MPCKSQNMDADHGNSSDLRGVTQGLRPRKNATHFASLRFEKSECCSEGPVFVRHEDGFKQKNIWDISATYQLSLAEYGLPILIQDMKYHLLSLDVSIHHLLQEVWMSSKFTARDLCPTSGLTSAMLQQVTVAFHQSRSFPVPHQFTGLRFVFPTSTTAGWHHK